MSPPALRPLLTKSAFTPADVAPAAALCRDWFKATASIEAFTVAAVFDDLIARNFDDPQGVPSADWQRFVVDVLPRIVAVVDDQTGDPIPAIRALVIGYHSSL